MYTIDEIREALYTSLNRYYDTYWCGFVQNRDKYLTEVQELTRLLWQKQYASCGNELDLDCQLDKYLKT